MGLVWLFVALNIACIIVCHQIAKNKGGNPVFWGIMGALFGPLAIPFAFFAKPNGDAKV